MKAMIGVMVLALLGAAAWFVGSALSSDALGMIIGLLFGILVPLPGMFLVLVAARRNAEKSPFRPPAPPAPAPPAPAPPAALLAPPTVIVVQPADVTRARATVIEGQRRIGRQ